LLVIVPVKWLKFSTKRNAILIETINSNWNTIFFCLLMAGGYALYKRRRRGQCNSYF